MPLDSMTIAKIVLDLDSFSFSLQNIYLYDSNGNRINDFNFEPDPAFDYGIDPSNSNIISILAAYNGGAPLFYKIYGSGTFAETGSDFDVLTDPDILRPANWMLEVNWFLQQSLGLSTTSPGGVYSFSGSLYLQVLLYFNSAIATAENPPEFSLDLAFTGSEIINLDGWTESAEIPAQGETRWVGHVIFRGNPAGNGAVQWSVQIGYDIIQDSESSLSIRYTNDYTTFTEEQQSNSLFVQIWNGNEWSPGIPLANRQTLIEIPLMDFWVDVYPDQNTYSNPQHISFTPFQQSDFPLYRLRMEEYDNLTWNTLIRDFSVYFPPYLLKDYANFQPRDTFHISIHGRHSVSVSNASVEYQERLGSPPDYEVRWNFRLSEGTGISYSRAPNWKPMKLKLYGVNIGAK